MPNSTISLSTESIQKSLIRSFEQACAFDEPYPHWLLDNVFPEVVIDAINSLPFEAPALEASGTREMNNNLRNYFDRENNQKYPVMQYVSEAFQTLEVVSSIEKIFKTNLKQTFLRLEYSQDISGFWLEPHTDIGVKNFSMLSYVSRDNNVKYGTDVYYDKDRHCKNTPYKTNTALVFVPSDNTWHGFEKREIKGVRKSVIINYVTKDWRAREQLPFQDTPVYS